jgi:hypothetical protein
VPTSEAATAQVVEKVARQYNKSDFILVVGAINKSSEPFASSMGEALKAAGFMQSRVIIGYPEVTSCIYRVDASPAGK